MKLQVLHFRIWRNGMRSTQRMWIICFPLIFDRLKGHQWARLASVAGCGECGEVVAAASPGWRVSWIHYPLVSLCNLRLMPPTCPCLPKGHPLPVRLQISPNKIFLGKRATQSRLSVNTEYHTSSGSHSLFVPHESNSDLSMQGHQ